MSNTIAKTWTQRGVHILSGRLKSGKTRRMLAVAHAVAQGGHNVLWVNSEIKPDALAARYRDICAGEGATALSFLHANSTAGLSRYLNAWCELHVRPISAHEGLIVLDTLRPDNGLTEAALRDIAHRHSVAIVIIRHTSKSDEKSSQEAPSIAPTFTELTTMDLSSRDYHVRLKLQSDGTVQISACGHVEFVRVDDEAREKAA